MTTRCNTCQGTYLGTLPEGTRYFHACPMIPNPLYQPDPTKPLFNLTQYIERAGKRDENLVVVDPSGKTPDTTKTAGTGVTTF